MANYCTRWRPWVKGLSLNGGRANFFKKPPQRFLYERPIEGAYFRPDPSRWIVPLTVASTVTGCDVMHSQVRICCPCTLHSQVFSYTCTIHIVQWYNEASLYYIFSYLNDADCWILFAQTTVYIRAKTNRNWILRKMWNSVGIFWDIRARRLINEILSMGRAQIWAWGWAIE